MKGYKPPPIMRFLALAFTGMLTAYTATAQDGIRTNESSEYLSVSVNGGFTITHADFAWSSSVPSPVFGIGCHYSSLDYLDISLDFQKGLLKGGEPLSDEVNKTGYENKFTAICLSFRFAPIAMVDNKGGEDKVVTVLSYLYFGTGLGYLHNNVKANYISVPQYGSMVRSKGSNLFIPLELGTYIPVKRTRKNVILLNINFRTNLCLSDEIDGYVPTVEDNKHKDAFSALTAGVVYRFGL